MLQLKSAWEIKNKVGKKEEVVKVSKAGLENRALKSVGNRLCFIQSVIEFF